MLIDDNIFIFANSYTCPLGKRCEGCVLEEISKVDKFELFSSIKEMDYEEKQKLIRECKFCIRANENVASY